MTNNKTAVKRTLPTLQAGAGDGLPGHVARGIDREAPPVIRLHAGPIRRLAFGKRDQRESSHPQASVYSRAGDQ